jgi:hypothetical protein
MSPDLPEAEPSVALASASAGTATEPAVSLPRLRGFSMPRIRVAAHPLAGRVALTTLLVCTFVVVAYATSGVTPLVPRSYLSLPNWESGPLHLIFKWLPRDQRDISYGFSAMLGLMLISYAVVLASMRTLSMRRIVAFVLIAHAVILLSPPLQLSDVWNYLGYARLGALHGINPYRHTMLMETHDPVYLFASWHALKSPYGSLFSALTYPLAFVPIPVAYWIIKVVTLSASLGFLAVVWRCAKLLGRDPRFAIVFIAANPIYLIYAMAGFHNDFFLLLPSMGAIALTLAKRDRAAGAVLMLAVAVKFTALIVLPFLFFVARPVRRRWALLSGVAIGAVPLVALSLALFGFSFPNLSQQSTLLTDFSIPNVFGLLFHLGGGTPGLLRVANVGLVVVIALLLRASGDWLARVGWATVALIATLSWLMPWYVIWVLPLAVLGTSVRLRRVSLALTLFLVFSFVPWLQIFMGDHNINPLNTSAGRASSQLAQKLSR